MSDITQISQCNGFLREAQAGKANEDKGEEGEGETDSLSLPGCHRRLG